MRLRIIDYIQTCGSTYERPKVDAMTRQYVNTANIKVKYCK